MPDGTYYESRSLRPTDDDVADNYGYRERYEDGDDSQRSLSESAGAAAKSPEEIAALISADSHKMVIEFEVGGPEGYQNQYRHPEWPGGESGITIGFGYDLGYYKLGEFSEAWSALLSGHDFDQLRPAVGQKQETAHALLGSVKRLVIPIEAADAVYRKVTVPKFGRWTLGAFPGSDALHPHCFGALFSLVYNRGASLKGDRRVEMRAMRDAIAAGNPEQIPELFHDMKHLWTARQSGLWKRRDAEANLFQRGLDEMRKARQSAPTFAVASATSSPEPSASVSGSVASDSQLERVGGTGVAPTEDGDLGFGPEEIYDDVPVSPDMRERAPGHDEWAHVQWVADDNMSTEYRHILPADREKHHDAAFLFSAADMDLLLKANAFLPLPPPMERRIVFGLRGALLDHDGTAPGDAQAQVDRPALRLKVTRPNHKDFRCTIGVYDPDSQKLSGFVASTVPNRQIVDRYYRTHDQGNMLTCGSYRYRVGAHHNGRYPGCFRQDEPMAVLRSRTDAIYDVRDDWDVRFEPPPQDNIHPAFSDASGSSEFSSFGCQVIRGKYQDDAYTQEFAKFRAALGFSSTNPTRDHNRLYGYVLLTGLEAVIAAQLRQEGRDGDPIAVRDSLVRIRQGSRGDTVRALQTALGRTVTGVFSAKDKQALVELQRNRLGPDAGDGVYSPAVDRALALGVFGDAPPPPQPMIVASLGNGRASGSTRLESAADGAAVDHPALEAVLFDIGRRTTMARRAPDLIGADVLPYYEAITRAGWEASVAVGDRVVRRVERLAHEIICNDLASEASDRQEARAMLAAAIPQGLPALTQAMSGVLTGWLGVAPSVATPIAETIVTRIAASSQRTNSSAPFGELEPFLTAWGASLFQAALAAGPATPHAESVGALARGNSVNANGRRV